MLYWYGMLEGNTIIEIAVVLITIVISLTIHESVHALVGYKLGDTTAHQEGRITLNPLRHIDPYITVMLPLVLLLLGQPPILAAKPVPFNPARVKFDEFGAALIGVAGPLSNLALAILGAIGLRIANIDAGSAAYEVMLIFIMVNVSVFVFNMLPLPPLDGSRLLYAVAPPGLQRIMEQIEAAGIVFVLVILFLLLPVIGPFLQTVNQNLLIWLL